LFDLPTLILSTAELVNVYHECAVYAKFFNDSIMNIKSVSQNLINSFDFEDDADVSALRYYFEKVVKERAKNSEIYSELYKSRVKIR
jgi:hypothetical protein